ncbi:MAG: CxxxxCH/CxxCH domain-containing protein [Anaeromyxobacteraceae bacterium]
MKIHAFAIAVACVLAGSVTACSEGRSASAQGEGASVATCTACHGGTDGDSGAPPKDLKGRTATTEVPVGAHTAHVKAGPLAAAIDCGACHRKPSQLSSAGHMDGAVQVTWGGIAGARGASPSWSEPAATCSNVYCHGATLTGGTNTTPVWTKVDGTQAACGTCHGLPPTDHPALAAGFTTATCNACHPETVKADGTVDAPSGRHVNGVADGFTGHPAGWLDRSSAGFHGPIAKASPADCQRCHALQAPATVSALTCTNCHDKAGSGDWTMGCGSCHGSTANPAPPRDLLGNTATSFLGVGAHQSHVTGKHGFAAPMDCTSCHPKPATSSSAGHLDGKIQVTGYTGSDADLAAAVKAPGWSRASASCNASYCHGNAPGLDGGAVTAPTWTRVDGSQAFCGSCHGLPPTNHPALAAGSDAHTCGACHPDTVKDDGTIDLAKGKHLNGRADGFAGHPAEWMTKGSAGFHGQAVIQGTACFGCHAAAAPAHGSAVTCASCHDALAGGDWTTSCSGCHGSASNAAPPKDLQGNTATTVVGVGAHQSHVTGAHGMAAPMDCVHCHKKPSDPFSPGHMDGNVQLTGYTGSNALLAQKIASQGWDDAAATCTNYCHGASMQGGTNTRPTWTKVDGTQAACGACHGMPGSGHLPLAPGSTAATCALCHTSTVLPDGRINVAGGKHLNGRIDAFWGHPAGWMTPTSPDFHGKPSSKDEPSCFVCHAKEPPARGAAFTCADCHTSLASGDWRTACNGCHGSATSDAPPKDLAGNLATTSVGVGAHQSHLQGTHGVAAPLDCTACHRKPTSPIQALHMNGVTEVTGYTGTDPGLLAAGTAPGWSRASESCATSYCHGATLGGGTAMQPVWTRVDGGQVACGSCHGLPPPGHMTVPPPVTPASCSACHRPTVNPDGSINVAGGKHVNGTVETEGIRGHGAGWFVPGGPASHGRVAVEDGVDTCFRCHSAKDPSTNGIRTCASCHDALAGGSDWTTSCLGCHGSGNVSAPPRDVHGNYATTAIGVGAHRPHVEATSRIARRYDCDTCHMKPAVVFAPGHLDGATTVTGYTGTDARYQFVKDPGWNRSTATCATTWCHGGYTGTFTYFRDDGSGTLEQVSVNYAGRAARPVWTAVDDTQDRCGSCHGAPPGNGTWHNPLHGGVYGACDLCHPGVSPDGTAFLDASQHVNGVVDVTPAWSSACFNCH